MALVAQYELKIDQLDVKTTFLHGNLDEIFLSQPTRFKTVRKENMVCKLKKSLYGLIQSPRQWYKYFDSSMRGKGTQEAITTHVLITISYQVESMVIYYCM